MMTLKQFSRKIETIPVVASWHLAELGEARGKQELFTRQAPQRLKALREHAVIESAVSSNRIEGVEVDQDRIRAVVLGRAHLRDRDEEEVRGYQSALKLIHEQGNKLSVSEDTIRQLHKLTRGEIWDAGRYKSKDGDIIEKYPDGRERVRFKTVTAARTPAVTKELVVLWEECLRERWVHPLIAMAAFNLDFLCIHPFRDGNGRVSRLLLLLQCYHLGFRSRPLHQHRAHYRAEQGPLLRNACTKLPRLARRKTQSLAVYQLCPLHAQDSVPGIRGAGGAGQDSAGSKDGARRVGRQGFFQGLHTC